MSGDVHSFPLEWGSSHIRELLNTLKSNRDWPIRQARHREA